MVKSRVVMNRRLIMSSAKFTVSVQEQSSSSAPRIARRVIFNTDVLKSLKLITGDVVAVSKSEGLSKAFAVGIVWPSLEQAPDCKRNLTMIRAWD